MPTIPVDENGTVLYFEDTGPPPSVTLYTTIILIHGLIFHGAAFRRLVPFAAKSNIRLVFLNMRDYPGSSPYTATELEALQSLDLDIQDSAVKKHGTELATFLAHFIRDSHLPTPQESPDQGAIGGVVVLSWSLGNIVTHSFLAHAHGLPKDTQDILAKYLRSMVLHAVSGVGIGSIPIGSSLYSPLRDQSLSASEKLEQFAIWVSSYYPPIDNLSEVELEDLTSRKPLHLPESPHHDPQMRPTIEQMSLDEFASMTDVGALDRSSQFLIRVNQTIYRRNFERAHWFDSNIPLNERIWPNLKILVLWCNMDMVDCIWAISHFHRRWKNHLDDINQPGWEKCRNIEFLKFEGGNHFPHFLEPEKFIQLLSGRI